MKGLFHQKPLFLGSFAVKKIVCSIQRKVGPVGQNIRIVKIQILLFCHNGSVKLDQDIQIENNQILLFCHNCTFKLDEK